ncbi:MAG TPA: SDR family oxidoreductase [Verrucomicrobiae bacterium]|jgi:NAD(P)-dependent dehydrogenase (short-subunit alcohol dehydrogenase family)|nr:SDR family oxidoreductase [Verrucomicrobiae bacterium]
MKLKNLNTLITGGSQGLGKVIAEHFLTEGANVALCARNEKELFATRDELAKKFPEQKVVAKTCDVSNESQVNALVAFAIKELGSLQALVLNAGVYGPMGPTEEVPLEEWRRAMDINLYGVLLPCRAVIPHFKQNFRSSRGDEAQTEKKMEPPHVGSYREAAGKIIILSGGGATNPLPNISSYAASKAAVVRLMETFAEELKPFHVDVNAIAPGALATRLVDEVLAAGPEKVGAAFYEKNKQWKEKGATPPELGARLAVYLASTQSDGITGKLISAQWDPWEKLHEFKADLNGDIYALRRIVPKDRGKTWGDK